MIILINNNDILSSPIAAITLWKRQKSETKMNAVTAIIIIVLTIVVVIVVIKIIIIIINK